MRFRKKPVVIDAVKWTGFNLEDCLLFLADGKDSFDHLPDDGVNKGKGIGVTGTDIFIPTLEGMITCSLGDFIIKGVNGEFYPCKPDIFNFTYEPVDNQSAL